MKYMFEKIAISIVGLGLSILVAILGMYLVFNSELKFLYHLLFSAAFILQPVMTIVLIRYLFRKPGEKPEKKDEYDEYEDYEDEEDEEEVGEQPAFSFPKPHIKPAAAPAPAVPAPSAPTQSAPAQSAQTEAPVPELYTEPENEPLDLSPASDDLAPGEALEELERMQLEDSRAADPDYEPIEDSSLAGVIGKKLGGIFGKKSGDDL